MLFPEGLPSVEASGDGEAENEAESGLWRVERGLAGVLAVSMVVGPWLFMRYADRITYEDKNLAKLLAYKLDIWGVALPRTTVCAGDVAATGLHNVSATRCWHPLGLNGPTCITCFY